LDNEAGSRLLDQFMNLFVYPEVEKRQKAGQAEKPLNLRAAQILFFPDGRRPLVRINSEIKAIGSVKIAEGLPKPQPGEPVREDQIESLDEINRPEDDYPDCGHATLIRIRDRWTIAFDFRYNRKLAQKHILAAREFCDSAERCLEHEEWHAFVDNLFSAAELAVKSMFLSMADKTRTHRSISRRFNRYADLGNIQPAHKKTFNKLYGARDAARYLKREVRITKEEARILLDNVRDIIDSASRRAN